MSTELKDVLFFRGKSENFTSVDLQDDEGGTFFYMEDTGDVHVSGPNGTTKCLTASGGAEIKTYEVEVGTSWSGDSSAGWSQSITVDGIKSTDEPIIDVLLDSTVVNTNKKSLEAWAKVSHIITADNSITVYSYAATKPGNPFKIQLKVVK